MLTKADITIERGQHLINGEWVDSTSGETFETENPATGEMLGTAARGSAEDIDRAVKAARRAFEKGPWRRTSARERGRLLYKLADLIESHADELARLETLDNGKPLRESHTVDLPMVIDCFRYYGGLADKVHGETIPVSGNFLNYTLREPMGVVGQIIPWNFPLLMAAWKLAPALATGNCCVLKPAEQTPLTALRLGQLIMEVGFPEGVVNIVTGYGDAGAALAAHMDVDKVAFTGHYITGESVMKAAAESNLKRVSLELGGKSPNIIFADADIGAAVRGAAMGIFFNQGEVCCAGSRLFVEEQIHDEVVAAVVEQAKSLKVGDPFDPSTEMGAQVSREQFDKILGYVAKGKEEGATCLTGGGRLGDRGYFIQPTVFDDVSNNMTIAQDEIFGPVVATLKFRDVEEVIQAGNDSYYGLAAAVWTRDISKAHRAARALKAGTVWVNCYNTFDPASPFGGYKMSGFGRENGIHVLELYTQVKSIWVNLD